MTLDRNWHIGVCGWRDEDGRHVRLAEVVEAAPEHAHQRLREHLNSCLLLWLVLTKLQREVDEVGHD